MKIKPIEPGMVIHCKNNEEYNELNKVIPLPRMQGNMKVNDFAFQVIEGQVYCASKEYFGGEYIEFTDLIVPELSAEEVFEIMAEMHKECYGKINGCLGCPIRIVAEHCDADCFGKNAKAIIEICEQWKADHAEKEPEVEIEWFWQGMIYRVLDSGSITQLPNGEGIYDTGCEFRESAEDYMADELKEFCKCHEGRYIAVIERVCRVKGA